MVTGFNYVRCPQITMPIGLLKTISFLSFFLGGERKEKSLDQERFLNFIVRFNLFLSNVVCSDYISLYNV